MQLRPCLVKGRRRISVIVEYSSTEFCQQKVEDEQKSWQIGRRSRTVCQTVRKSALGPVCWQIVLIADWSQHWQYEPFASESTVESLKRVIERLTCKGFSGIFFCALLLSLNLLSRARSAH